MKNDMIPMRKKKEGKHINVKVEAPKEKNMIGKNRETKHGRNGKLWFLSRLRGNSSCSATFQFFIFSEYVRGTYTLWGTGDTEINCIDNCPCFQGVSV